MLKRKKKKSLKKIVRDNYSFWSKIFGVFILVFAISFLSVSIAVREDRQPPQIMLFETPVEEVSTIAELIERETEAEPVAVVDEIEPDLEEFYAIYEEELPEDINIPEPKVSVKEPPKTSAPQDDRALIAIVIDDMGISHKRTKDISSLHAPITSSFLTYGTSLDTQVNRAIEAGHEIIVHIPMEAKTNIEVAPDVLTTGMSRDEIRQNLKDMLRKFKHVKGGNNHMGSVFTENEKSMSAVLEVLKEENLFFLDSKTSPNSVAGKVADNIKVKHAERQVFLDNDNDYDYIMGQLKIAETTAGKNGHAIAIGHPKSETYKALKDWLPTLEEKNIKLVHVSEIVRLQTP